ncbi:hypothetical protein FNF27_08075 [Cafeteria roenbergensis]|uniref:FZ domain-containing protein n=1 Tax=Cafeteria roenbergensis TaxID=33653 RepID=A0A5A8DAH6_CAFRO|nr:hypothetical protein FNF27_08075 [Cafeteria roenbergensis]
MPRALWLLQAAVLAAVASLARAGEQCPTECAIPEGLSFCAGVVEYRSCSEDAAKADAEAQQFANASGLLGCFTGRRAACLAAFPACEFSKDVRQLCQVSCADVMSQACSAPEALAACSPASLPLGTAAENCFDADYTGASYGMWALGLAINFAFSFMAALGLNLQKRSIELHKGSRKPLHRQPLWVFGCCTMTCGSVFDFVAFGLAPMSLLAPLAALTLVWNMLIARWLHAEVVDRANIIATGVIFAGVTLAVIFSSHATPLYTVERIAQLFFAPEAVAYLLLTCVAMAVSGTALWRTRGRRPGWKVFAYGMLAGAMGGQSVVFAKATVEIIKAAMVGAASMLSAAPWLVGGLTALLLLTQLRVLNAGLAEFPALTMIPVYQSVWILASTLSGLIYFAEWGGLTGVQQGCFVFGTALTLAGIGVLLRAQGNAAGDAEELSQADDRGDEVSLGSDSSLDDDGVPRFVAKGGRRAELEMSGVLGSMQDAEAAAVIAGATAAAARPRSVSGGTSDSDLGDLLVDGDLGAGHGASGYSLAVPADGAFAIDDGDDDDEDFTATAMAGVIV